MVPDASPWIARANHGWLARVQLGAWLLPIAIVLQTLIPMLGLVCRWVVGSHPWKWPVYLAAGSEYITLLLPAFPVVAFWLLTAPEPRPQLMRQSASTRRWARWLTIVAYLMPFAFAFLPSLWPGDDYVTQTFVSTIAMICLLILVRNYGLRYHDTAGAKLLRVIAILGGGAAFAGLLSAVLIWFSMSGRPSWGLFLLTPLALVIMAFGLAQLWAMIRFALGFQRAVHSQRPQIRLAPVLWFTLAAIVLGGIAGTVARSMFLAYVNRADPQWTGLPQQLYWSLQPFSIILAAACLPHRLQRLFRVYTRRGQARQIASRMGA